MLGAYNNIIPEPKSRFVEIECLSCGSPTVVFTMAKSIINCKFCGNLLAEPTGGEAILFGKLPVILDKLPEKTIKTFQTHPSVKTTKLLLDTMIIHQLINGTTMQDLGYDVQTQNLEFILLDRILIETKNMEYHEYNRVLDIEDDVINKLNKLGTVTRITLDHASKQIIQAKKLYESKKYQNADKIPLSETDCILLQIALDAKDCKLVTFDATLIHAYDMEKN